MWSGAVGLPLVGAALHPFLGVMVQRAARLGVRLSIILGFANLITFGIFAVYLRPEVTEAFGLYDLVAIANGVLFFLGQWYSAKSVAGGDLVVHSSALGLKVLLVALLSAGVGLEPASAGLFGGAVLAAIAVYLVAGATMQRLRENRTTLVLTLLACIFFGANDFMTGWKSQEVGAARWLLLMMGTAGVLSVGVLLPRVKEVVRVFRGGAAALPICVAGVLLGLQALCVNLAFGLYREPALSNIAFSTRGVMAVFFVWLIVNKARKPLGKQQLTGAGLMVLALVLVLI